MGRRHYTFPGQILVWIIEGPERPWWAAYVLSSIGMLVMSGQFFGWYQAGIWAFAAGLSLCVVSWVWHYSRRAQIAYYKHVVRLWFPRTCGKCGYPMQGIDTRVCPECGTERRCPRCEYSLVGTESDVCPECGTNIPVWVSKIRRGLGLPKS